VYILKIYKLIPKIIVHGNMMKPEEKLVIRSDEVAKEIGGKREHNNRTR